MKKFLFVFYILISLTTALFSQNSNKVEVKFHGFIKADYFLDSRQNITAREGHFLLFPKIADFDLNGADINATPSFNILAIQTRLKTVLTGPDFYGAKSSAVIEAAFFGHSNADINGLRLRHAFIKLNWELTELIIGQYWHPMFVTKAFPGVYSFNTGAPFQPFSRNPQLRITHGKKIKLIGTLYSQRDFSSKGPDGTSSIYLRNSGIPAMNLQVQFSTSSLFGGVGIDYKVLKPTLSVDNIKFENNLTALSYIAFMNYRNKTINVSLEGTYGENMSDLLMIGGMTEYIDHESTHFTNIKSLALWTDISTSIDNIEIGAFGGYAKNIGTKEALNGAVYAFGGDIESMWRVSIRSAIKSGVTKFGIEIERTEAQYGVLEQGATTLNIGNMDPVANYRLLLFGMYSF